jgi:hypothetical protein
VQLNYSTGCWEWRGSSFRFCYSDPLGYRLTTPSQWSYAFFFGVQNVKMVVRKCRNSKCVNPQHLYIAGTVNVEGRKKEFCKRGHRLSEENIVTYPPTARTKYTKRVCKLCAAARVASYNKKNSNKRTEDA